MLRAALAVYLADEWDTLSPLQQRVVLADFRALLRDEYDYDDPTTDLRVQSENVIYAATEYHRRIGAGNLASYAQTLLAGSWDKNGDA